jgi:hypothetical protein
MLKEMTEEVSVEVSVEVIETEGEVGIDEMTEIGILAEGKLINY